LQRDKETKRKARGKSRKFSGISPVFLFVSLSLCNLLCGFRSAARPVAIPRHRLRVIRVLRQWRAQDEDRRLREWSDVEVEGGGRVRLCYDAAEDQWYEKD